MLDNKERRTKVNRADLEKAKLWLLEQDSYCNATFGNTSVAKARSDLSFRINQIKSSKVIDFYPPNL